MFFRTIASVWHDATPVFQTRFPRDGSKLSRVRFLFGAACHGWRGDCHGIAGRKRSFNCGFQRVIFLLRLLLFVQIRHDRSALAIVRFNSLDRFSFRCILQLLLGLKPVIDTSILLAAVVLPELIGAGTNSICFNGHGFLPSITHLTRKRRLGSTPRPSEFILGFWTGVALPAWAGWRQLHRPRKEADRARAAQNNK